eukprot:TRINITY_DN18564_c0_g1_i1.p3 TRINITY_DN18564_c0_g1~~TRINITY_DN18564_c0_g1_i1.p3  ORF type:complete len:131 (-),score=7.85 TRINITY_DN18564_c0_g1_i1:376-768(-)
MKRNNIDKNQKTYELIFLAFSRGQDLQGMQVVLNDMRRYNFSPSSKLLFKALEHSIQSGSSEIESKIRKELAMMGITQIQAPKLQSDVQKHYLREGRIGSESLRQEGQRYRQKYNRAFAQSRFKTQEEVG